MEEGFWRADSKGAGDWRSVLEEYDAARDPRLLGEALAHAALRREAEKWWVEVAERMKPAADEEMARRGALEAYYRDLEEVDARLRDAAEPVAERLAESGWLPEPGSSRILRGLVEEKRRAELEWAASALEELLRLRAWVRALKARHARAGINTHALDERLASLEKLIKVLYEYLDQLEASSI
ncbi:MAG: hypothetical protein DRK00_10895 [Thermoprotei archaeon]|nr:MAG: hypothetical protein DRK00_10895 [Thermoprotei archaeon]